MYRVVGLQKVLIALASTIYLAAAAVMIPSAHYDMEGIALTIAASTCARGAMQARHARRILGDLENLQDQIDRHSNAVAGHATEIARLDSAIAEHRLEHRRNLRRILGLEQRQLEHLQHIDGPSGPQVMRRLN